MKINKFFFIHTFMAIVFFVSGLIINICQGVLYLVLYNLNRPLYRKINYYLIYTSWSQVVAMTEWWSQSSCTMYYADEESFKHFGKEHAIVVMNHKYDVDWLMCWLVCDKLNMLGNAKTCAKTSLRYLPVIGWGWVFAEMVFLERNWGKDSVSLGEKLDKLFGYEDPIMILFFCEGTRFTPEKHKASMKFAEAHNLPKLKHHLLPRTKGFNFSVSHLKNKANAVYDVQVAFPNDVRPTFFDMLRGEKFEGEMYIRRIPISEIPTDSDEATTAWLYNLYQKKDEVMDEYLKTNKFPGRRHRIERKVYPLLNVFIWLLVVGVPFFYFLVKILTCGVLWVQALTVTGVAILSSLAYMMIGVTKSDKGSSYGKSDSSITSKRNGVITDSALNGDVIEESCASTSNSPILCGEQNDICEGTKAIVS